MNKRQQLIIKYKEQLKNSGVAVDDALLEKVTIGCGPSIYRQDASTVSANDPAELDRVKKNFLIKKLGLPDTPALDKAIAETIDTIGKSIRNKYRAVFYYILVKKLGKESAY